MNAVLSGMRHPFSSESHRQVTCFNFGKIAVVVFSSFMLTVHERHPFEATYLEHAFNPLIQQWCTRRGWTPDPGTFPPSFYLLKTKRAGE